MDSPDVSPVVDDVSDVLRRSVTYLGPAGEQAEGSGVSNVGRSASLHRDVRLPAVGVSPDVAALLAWV